MSNIKIIKKTIIDTVLIYTKWIRIIFSSKFHKSGNHKSSNKKILFLLASQLPPNTTGGVFRPLSFLKNAKKHHWNCKAFSFNHTVKNTEAGEYLLSQIPNSVTLERVEPSNLLPSWKLTPRIDGGLANSFEMFDYIVNKNSDVPDVILATGPNFNTFLTAFYLSKYYNCPLVIDYRDEWSLCPFSWIKKEITDHYLEKMIGKHASKIIFTTQSHIYNYVKHFPNIDKSKHVLIANGYDEDELKKVNTSNSNTKKFTVSFIGSLGDHNLPNNFLNNLDLILKNKPDLIDNLQINFVGVKSTKAKQAFETFKFSNTIKLIDHVSKSESLTLMQNSDALLILAGEGMSGYIPGKLYDYLSLKKPIIFYGESGETSHIINTLSAGISIEENDYAKLNSALLSLVNKQFISDNKLINGWLINYTRSKLAEILFSQLDSLVEETR